MAVMLVLVVGSLVALVVIVGLALWSDRRDRQAGIDPKVRIDDLLGRRQQVREERANRTVRRYLGDDERAGRGRRSQ